MTFLPVVERELLVGSRRRWTYWGRFVIALLGTLIVGWMAWSASNTGGRGGALGPQMFAALGGLGWFVSLFAGVVLTADCLSAEKRDGTLGLLFLTDLRAADVVKGKLAATSVQAFYGFLAIFPLLASTLVFGGVTFGEVARMVLVLLHTLFFSLAVGVVVSAVVWQQRTALVATTGVLVFAGWLLPWCGPLGWLSPRTGYRLVEDAAYQAEPWLFSASLVLVQAASWLLLWWAGRLTPQFWHDWGDPTKSAARRQKTFRRRTRLLEKNPIEWLSSRGGKREWLYVAGVLIAIVVLPQSHLATFWRANPALLLLIATVSHALLKLWIAWEAGRRFAEYRRSGVMELILCTPLKAHEIIRGQITSLERQFTKPVLAALAADLVLAYVGAMLVIGGRGVEQVFVPFAISMVLFLADCYALGWLGLWLGVKSGKPLAAALGAVARIMLLPLLCLPVGLVGLMPDGFELLLWLAVGGANAWFFGKWASKKLHAEFRLAATGVDGLHVKPPPPPDEPEEMPDYWFVTTRPEDEEGVETVKR